MVLENNKESNGIEMWTNLLYLEIPGIRYRSHSRQGICPTYLRGIQFSRGSLEKLQIQRTKFNNQRSQ